jgi:uncharacterized protein YfdQ (DUF2303 family)
VSRKKRTDVYSLTDKEITVVASALLHVDASRMSSRQLEVMSEFLVEAARLNGVSPELLALLERMKVRK